MLSETRGVLHDDGMDHAVNCAINDCSAAGAGAATNGYDDNLDCGVRIRGPRG